MDYGVNDSGTGAVPPLRPGVDAVGDRAHKEPLGFGFAIVLRFQPGTELDADQNLSRGVLRRDH